MDSNFQYAGAVKRAVTPALETGRRAHFADHFIGYPTEGYAFGDRGGRVAPPAADPSQATGRVKRRENQFTAPAYQKFKSSPLQRGVCELSVPCGASNFSSGRQQRVGLWPSPEDPLSPGTGAIRRAAPTAGGTPRTLSLNTRLGFGRSNDISYRRVKLSRISVAFGAQVGAAAVRFAASGLPTRSRGIEQGRFRVPFAPLDRDPAAISRTR